MTRANSAAFTALLDQADELRSDETLLDQAEATPSFLYRVAATIERETGKRPDPETLAKLVWLAFDATLEQLDDAELPGGEARASFDGEFADAARQMTSGFGYKDPATKKGKAGRAGNGSRPFLLPLPQHLNHCQSRAAQPQARAAAAPANLSNLNPAAQRTQPHQETARLVARNPGQCFRPLVLASRTAAMVTAQEGQAQINLAQAHQKSPAQVQKSEVRK